MLPYTGDLAIQLKSNGLMTHHPKGNNDGNDGIDAKHNGDFEGLAYHGAMRGGISYLFETVYAQVCEPLGTTVYS